MSRLLFLFACSTCLMGCILRDFDYEPPANLPPSVHGSTETPLDRIVPLNLSAPVGGGDGGVGSDLVFTALVRDANVDETLQYIWFIDRGSLELGADSDEFPILPDQDDTPGERVVTFRVPRNHPELATVGCHRVELHVSQRFQTLVTNARPATEGDLGVGVWWVAAYPNEAEPVVDMNRCPQ